METHRQGIDDLDLLDPRLEFPEAGAAVPLETELHVLRGDRIAVVELELAAQLELVHPSVPAPLPRLREAVPHLLPGQRADHSPVDAIGKCEGTQPRRACRWVSS